MHDPASIPLPVGVSLPSGKGREALIPPSLLGKGGRGVRSGREFKVSKSFSEMSIAIKTSLLIWQGWKEYWIVDPIQQRVTVLEWVEGFYEEKVYVGDSAIATLVFHDLKLTAVQLLQCH